MRIGLSILFMSIILVRAFSGAFIMLNFYANRNYIEKTFCIYKKDPHSKCHGHCHLKKQLQEEEGDTRKSNPTYPFKMAPTIDLFFQIIEPLVYNHYLNEKQIRDYPVQTGFSFFKIDMWRHNRSP